MIEDIRFVVPESKVYRLTDQETGETIQFQSYDTLDKIAERIMQAGINPPITTEKSYIDETLPYERPEPTSVIKG